MLQWMGGSRRNVTTTRKSTLQRQKQYFEQRRRNLQRESSSNQGVKTCEHQYKAHRSLDILNLQTLSTLAQERKSSNLKGKKDGVIDASTASYDFPKDPPLTSGSVTGLTNAFNSKKAEVLEDSTTYHWETSPKKVLSGFNHQHSKGTIEKTNQKTAFSEQQLSIFDLLDGDQPKDNVQGQPTLEAHVAFSVEGLGKVGTETPVHSPRQAHRNPYGRSSLLKYAKKRKEKNLNYILDDFELEVMQKNCRRNDTYVTLFRNNFDASAPDDRMQHAGIPLMDSSLDFPMEPGSYSKLKQNSESVGDGIHYNLYSTNVPDSSTRNRIIYNYEKERNLGTSGDYMCFNDFNTDGIHGSSFRNRNFYKPQNVDEIWNGVPINFFDEYFPNERELPVAWKKKACHLDDNPTDFLVNDSRMASYAFNGLSQKKRALEPDMADILELPASHSKHKLSDWFDSSISQRAGNFDVEDPTGRPHCFTGFQEDVTDNASVLSEESCSSTAVGVNITKNLPAKLPTEEDRRRKHGHGCAGSGNYYDDCIGGKCFCSNPPKPKPSHHSAKILEDLGAHDSWHHEREYASTSFDLFGQNPKNELPISGCENKSDDKLSGLRIPTSHTKVKPLSGGVIAHMSIMKLPLGSFSEKFVFRDSPEWSAAELRPTRCHLSPDLNLKSSTPDVGVSDFVSKSINSAEHDSVSKQEMKRRLQQTDDEISGAENGKFVKGGS